MNDEDLKAEHRTNSARDFVSYQSFLAKAVTTANFTCIIAILGFGLGEDQESHNMLAMFAVSLPVTLIMAMNYTNPRQRHRSTRLINAIYFFSLLSFSFAFFGLIYMHSNTAGIAMAISVVIMAIASAHAEKRKK